VSPLRSLILCWSGRRGDTLTIAAWLVVLVATASTLTAGTDGVAPVIAYSSRWSYPRSWPSTVKFAAKREWLAVKQASEEMSGGSLTKAENGVQSQFLSATDSSPVKEAGGVESGMPEPRCLIIVKSVHHGNTARIACEMAGVLGADVVAPEEIPFTSLAQYGLVGFGSGVFYGRMHQALFELLRGLPDAPEPTKPAFVFSTSGLRCLEKLWHGPLKKLLARKGFDVVGEFSCRGFDTWGPLWLTGGLNWRHPDERDQARARKFAGRVRAAVPNPA